MNQPYFTWDLLKDLLYKRNKASNVKKYDMTYYVKKYGLPAGIGTPVFRAHVPTISIGFTDGAAIITSALLAEGRGSNPRR